VRQLSPRHPRAVFLHSCFFNVVRRLKVPSPFNSVCVQCCDGERAYSNAAPRSLVSASACARCLYLDVFLRRAVAVGAAGPSHLHSRACGAHVFWFGEPFPLGHLLWASANGLRATRRKPSGPPRMELRKRNALSAAIVASDEVADSRRFRRQYEGSCETARSYLLDHGFVQDTTESFGETMARALGIST